MSEWISVKEKKPPFLENVLVAYENGHVGIDYITMDDKFCFEGIYGRAVYWMLLEVTEVA